MPRKRKKQLRQIIMTGWSGTHAKVVAKKAKYAFAEGFTDFVDFKLPCYLCKRHAGETSAVFDLAGERMKEVELKGTNVQVPMPDGTSLVYPICVECSVLLQHVARTVKK